jgi:hypothetical protein
MALDGAKRIVLRSALEPLAGQGDGDVGAARLQFEGLAQESSSPAASSSSAREGTSESKSSSTLAFGTAPTNSLTTSPSRKALTVGMPWMPKRAESP